MNLDELWIGDTVRLKASGKVGTYIGQNNKGKARVKCGVKVILSKAKNIELYQGAEKEELVLDLISDDKPAVLNSTEVPREFDLHIEKLNPTLTHEAPQIILNHQLKKCREYVEQVIEVRHKMVTIVHGKGTGQLKLEVDYLLSQYEEFNYAIPTNNDGASEVWLKYE